MAMNRIRMAVPLLVVVCCGSACAARYRTEWTDDTDISRSRVFVGRDATSAEVEAAKFLLRAQVVLSGGADPTNVVPEVVSSVPEEGVVVAWMGTSLGLEIAKKTGLRRWKEAKNGTDMIAQVEDGGVTYLVGNAPEGAFYAVADVLYHNGARFIHTGQFADNFTSGIYLELLTSLKAPKARVYVPVAALRTGFGLSEVLWGSKRCTPAQFTARNLFAAANCASPHERSVYAGGMSRGFVGSECIQPLYHDFDKHPDFFPMNEKGERFRPTGGWCWVMEGCWSNPEFFDWVVDRISKRRDKEGADNTLAFNPSSSDGGPICKCPECEKLRASYPDRSSYYWDYNRRIQKALKDRYPDMRVEPYAYIMSLPFPKLGRKLFENVDAIDFCSYKRCYLHGCDDKTCPSNLNAFKTLEDWREAGVPIGEFNYTFDMFLPAMGVPVWELMADTVRHWKTYNGSLGIPRVYTEFATSPHSCGGKSRIASYVMARCLWDDSRSADEHLVDWCRAGFGPAADVMLAWERAASQAWTGQKAHVANTFNSPLGTARSYFTAELEAHGKRAFAESERLLKADAAAAGSERGKALAAKRLATLAWEKGVFDEWSKLRTKALRDLVEIDLPERPMTRTAFDGLRAYGMKTKFEYQGTDVSKSVLQCCRTKDALRVRLTSHGELFEPKKFKEDRNDTPQAYRDDSMEFFIQAPGHRDYVHVAVSADGDVYDAKGQDATWNSTAYRIESRQKTGEWELILTFPYAMFGLDGVNEGDVFKLVAICNTFKKGDKGQVEQLHVGVPFPAHHDIASGADLKVVSIAR